MKEQTNIQIFYLFIYLSEAESYYVTLACLDLTVQIRLAYNSEISLSPDVCSTTPSCFWLFEVLRSLPLDHSVWLTLLYSAPHTTEELLNCFRKLKFNLT